LPVTVNGPSPRLDHLPEDVRRRVALTVSCRDADSIAKVEHAGEVLQRDGVRVQVMHNGVLVEEGGYYGDWMTEIIRSLRGHHEPQEEVVFYRIIERLRGSEAPVMVEFGSFWAYYSLWFCSALADAGARAVAVEPDAAYLEVGRRNAALNRASAAVTFMPGAIGADPGEQMDFVAESDGGTHRVVQHDLHSVMNDAGVEYADLVLADVQGAESILLERARGDFAAGRVRFLVVSTHHHAISGDPLTHQRSLTILRESGAHVIAEHSVSESYSGDGLIAVSFDDRDKDFVVALSYARAKDSLFGESEFAVDAALRRSDEAERRANEAELYCTEADQYGSDLRVELAEVRRQLGATAQRADQAAAELAAMRQSRLWRWSRLPRGVYARVRPRR
jgi:FkbM family methyltransferase